jgi:hypothetical protein
VYGEKFNAGVFLPSEQAEGDNAALVTKMRELLSRYRDLQKREKELLVWCDTPSTTSSPFH